MKNKTTSLNALTLESEELGSGAPVSRYDSNIDDQFRPCAPSEQVSTRIGESVAAVTSETQERVVWRLLSA